MHWSLAAVGGAEGGGGGGAGVRVSCLVACTEILKNVC